MGAIRTNYASQIRECDKRHIDLTRQLEANLKEKNRLTVLAITECKYKVGQLVEITYGQPRVAATCYVSDVNLDTDGHLDLEFKAKAKNGRMSKQAPKGCAGTKTTNVASIILPDGNKRKRTNKAVYLPNKEAAKSVGSRKRD